jgi:hypothetical protein
MASTPAPYDPSGGYRNAPTGAPTPPGLPGPPPPDANALSNIIAVDTAQIAQAAAGFRAVAGDTRTAVNEARSRTEGTSLGATPWGQDPLGNAFGTQYAPVAQAMDQALDSLVALFDDIADRLAATGGIFTAAEDHAIHLASSLTKNT